MGIHMSKFEIQQKDRNLPNLKNLDRIASIGMYVTKFGVEAWFNMGNLGKGQSQI